MEAALGERGRKRVFAVGRKITACLAVLLPVILLAGRVLLGDVRRVGHHGMKAGTKQRTELGAHLGSGQAGPGLLVLTRVEEVELGALLAMFFDLLQPVGPVNVRMVTGRLGQGLQPGQLAGGHHQASASQSAGIVVQVDPHHPVQAVPDQSVPIPVRMLLSGGGHQALQPVDQKVPRPAGRVQQTDGIGAKGLQGRGQGTVEHELAHEVRRLAEGKAVLDHRVEVLVEVAHQLALEALLGKAPVGVGVRVAVSPELEQLARKPVSRQRDLGGLQAEELGQPSAPAGQVAVDPLEKGGLTQVRCQPFEELLGLRVEQSPGT